jgi:hypothetical protein
MIKTTNLLVLMVAASLVACNESAFSGPAGARKSRGAQTKPGKPEPEPVLEATASESETVRIVRKFEVAPLVEKELQVDFTRGVFEETLTLTSDYETTTKDNSQIDRPAYDKEFRQGSAGMAKADRFEQNALGILDLVVVVDNSGSMAEEQSNLSTKLAPLLQYVTGSNWVINVVTTDPSDGCTRSGLIKKGAANADAAFKAAVSAGIGGNGNERGILQAVNALSCAQVTGFPRANSSIAVLIVADEDNCSANGLDCPNTAYNTPAYLTNFLKDKLGRTLGRDARVYGIFWHPDTPAADCPTGLNMATQYAAAVRDTAGVFGSVCANDYAATLRKISQDMATILKTQFQLSSDPDPGTVVVKVNGVAQTAGFTLAGRVLTFTEIPPAGATVEVSYSVGAKPILTRFPLDERPALDTLQVMVNGNLADKSAYSVDAATSELVFKAAPADDAVVGVNFRKDIPLLKDFPLGAPVRAGTLVLTVDGAPATAYALDAQNVVHFTTPPPDAATISASFETFKGKTLDYPVALTGTTVENVAVFDTDTDEPVTASYQDGVLSVAEGEHVEGRKLLVLYENETSGVMELELPALPEADSVTLEGAPAACEDGLIVGDTKVTYTCPESSRGVLKLRFKHRAPTLTRFEMDDVDASGTGVWQVYVDGVETSAYEREGNVVILHDEPAPSATVKIVWASEI